MACLGGRMLGLEYTIGKFQKGNLYAIATRPGVGKTHFCMGVTCHLGKLGYNVLYISDAMDERTFELRLDRINPFYPGHIVFKECHKLTIEKLSQWLDEEEYEMLVIDPFDVYSWDVDVGELKDLAKEKSVSVLLSKNLTAESKNNEHLTLSTIRFPSQEVLDKFLAYTDIILLGYVHPDSGNACLKVAKNNEGSIGAVMEFPK